MTVKDDKPARLLPKQKPRWSDPAGFCFAGTRAETEAKGCDGAGGRRWETEMRCGEMRKYYYYRGAHMLVFCLLPFCSKIRSANLYTQLRT